MYRSSFVNPEASFPLSPGFRIHSPYPQCSSSFSEEDFYHDHRFNGTVEGNGIFGLEVTMWDKEIITIGVEVRESFIF